MNLASARGGQRHTPRRRKRYGRGIGSGIGKTCARGTKGQGARSGPDIHTWSEGGQMQLWRRTTKRGFSNFRHRDQLAELNVEDLRRFAPGTTIDLDTLRAAKLVRGKCDGWALLGRGECAVSGLVIVANRVTATARTKVVAAGGAIQAPVEPAPEKQA
jgi:large subunit ribosomal protein L15